MVRIGQSVGVSQWRDKPWYAGRPTSLVLYFSAEVGWRFALTTDRPAIVDGRLGETDLTPEQAKAKILDLIRGTEEVELDGGWRSDKPGWWSADLKPFS